MIYDDQTSSAMNYYEELGIGPDATEQEIRKAHRRLVKLMHPDAQPDQNLKMLAETQMRRLNSIVSTLLDSEQRRSYDEELQSASSSPQRGSLLPSLSGIPWWLASAVGAVVLTLAAVWLWADHMGNGLGSRSRTVYLPSAETSTVSEAPPVRMQPTPEQGNEIGSASYHSPVLAPVPAQQPPVSDSVSTAVVPDLPLETKPSAQSKEKPKEKTKEAPPAVLAASRAPEVIKKVVTPPAPVVIPEVKKQPDSKTVIAHKSEPKPMPVTPAVVKKAPVVTAKAVVPDASQKSSPITPPAPAPRKVFNLPSSTVIASAARPRGSGQLPVPPSVTGLNSREYGSPALPPTNLPAATPPKLAVVTTSTGANPASHDPLEGEWVYAPKEPEKRKAGFYPPEFIDLKLFGSGDPGSLKGQYSAKYVVTDRPVAPEVAFELASVSKGSRRFVWQSSSGAKGTLNIDPIDERTIRIDWHTTSAVGGPALTSGTATLVRRQ